MNLLFTICGRAGSKGIKDKNIKDFLGTPLPLYTLSAVDLFLKRNPNIKGEVAVNTDSEELLRILCNAGGSLVQPVIRKKKLAGDNVSKIAVIRDTYHECNTSCGDMYDMIIDLDLTSPLRTVKDIINIIEVQKRSKCDVTFSVTESRRNPYFNMVTKKKNGYERVISSEYIARQQLPEIFDMNASLYAYSPDFLMAGKEIFEVRCEILLMRDTGVLDLDHESDFELMEVIADFLYKKYPEYGEVSVHCKELFRSMQS